MTDHPPTSTNLWLRTGQRDYPVGKIVPHPQQPGRFLFHETVQPDWVRRDVGDDGFGINDAVVKHCVLHGIADLYFYLPGEPGHTYWTTLAQLHQFGIRNRAPKYGFMWNLPSGAWEEFDGRMPGLAWVEDDRKTFLYPPGKDGKLPKKKPPPPTHTQDDLW